MMYFRILAAALFAMGIVSAQGGRGNPTTSGGSAGSPTTGSMPGRPGSGTGTSPLSTSTSPFPGDAPHPILITGKVVLDDGSAPPPSVLLERVCAMGRPHPEGYTDSKGRFTITLGQEVGVMPDASETPNRNEMPGANPMGGVRDSQLMSCDLRASLAGFRSDTISLAGKRYLDNADVGTIVLHRMANVEGLTISATSSLAPKDAKRAYEKGLEAVKKSKPDDAQREFEKAVVVYPKYAAAWFELGRVYEQRDHFDKAREAYNQSLAADSKYVNPYERLYLLAARDKNWQEVADTTDKVLRLNPYDFPGAYYYNG